MRDRACSLCDWPAQARSVPTATGAGTPKTVINSGVVIDPANAGQANDRADERTPSRPAIRNRSSRSLYARAVTAQHAAARSPCATSRCIAAGAAHGTAARSGSRAGRSNLPRCHAGRAASVVICERCLGQRRVLHHRNRASMAAFRRRSTQRRSARPGPRPCRSRPRRPRRRSLPNRLGALALRRPRRRGEGYAASATRVASSEDAKLRAGGKRGCDAGHDSRSARRRHARAAISSCARPKSIGSPPLSRTTTRVASRRHRPVAC